MLIYLLRHAAVQARHPRQFLGQTDLPLSEEGLRQAQGLAAQLAPIRFAGVYASSLRRAVHTAMLVGGRAWEDVHRVEAFREIHLGDWEGLTVAEVEARFPGAYQARGANLADFRPPGGESFRDLAERAWPALLNIAQNGEIPGPLLIVAHAGVNRVLLARIRGLGLEQIFTIPQQYGALSCLRYSAGRFDMVQTLPA